MRQLCFSTLKWFDSTNSHFLFYKDKKIKIKSELRMRLNNKLFLLSLRLDDRAKAIGVNRFPLGDDFITDWILIELKND